MKVLNRAGVEGLSCRAEGGKASIELSLHRPAVVESGYARLLFRLGSGWQAGFKHLSIDSKQSAGVGHITAQVPLRETAGIVKNFYGIICAPAVKVNIPRRFDVWLMVLASGGVPSVSLSKPVLAAEKVSVQASLSADEGCLRYSLNAYGSGFRRAGLELVRQVYTGLSMSHGVERVTAREKLCEAWPGEAVQLEWRPVVNTAEPLLAAMKSYPSQGDVVALLRELGCAVRNNPFLGPRLEKTPFIVGDGEPVAYRLRLTVNGKEVDEAEVAVSFRDGR